MTELKNVVILGASAGGANVARALLKTLPATHRIVLIEVNEFAFWPIGALRAAVQPGFEKEIFASLDNFFPAGSRHVLLKGYKALEVTSTSVKLDKSAPSPFDSDTIDVDVGVIATGSVYAQPMRPYSTKLDESVAAIRQTQKDVAQAKRIVVMGGGPVGVEFCGEITNTHPDKRVTLIQRDTRLMPGWREALHNKLLAQLRAKNVDVRLGTTADVSSELMEQSQKLLSSPVTLKLADDKELDEVDFIFVGTGGSPNVSAVPDAALNKDVSPHRVAVDPATLRVHHESLNERWFCLGDACDVPDPKTNIAATAHAPIVAGQVLGQVTNSKKPLKRHTKAISIMAVPLGPSGGALEFIFIVLGEWTTSLMKGKSLLINLFTPLYPGGQPLKAQDA